MLSYARHPSLSIAYSDKQRPNYHGGLCALAPDHKDSALRRLAGVVDGFLMVGKTQNARPLTWQLGRTLGIDR
jgi:hypothetical protein